MSDMSNLDKKNAVENATLIRNVIQETQNTNILKLGWILIAAGLINVFGCIVPENWTYAVCYSYMEKHDLLDFMGIWVRGRWVDRSELFVQIRYAVFGLAWLALCIVCIIKRTGIKKSTFIRSELLLFDMWCWGFIYLPTVLLISDAVADGVTCHGRHAHHLWLHMDYAVSIVVDVVIICFVLIMTGLMLKKIWVSICSGVYMACLICFEEIWMLIFDQNANNVVVDGFSIAYFFAPENQRYYILPLSKAVLLIGIGAACIGVRLYHSVKFRRSSALSDKTIPGGEASAETDT